MLYELVKIAYDNPTWRKELVPLVKLGQHHERVPRVASGTVSLRSAIIRTAYESTDPKLRAALVKIVTAAPKTEVKIPMSWTEFSTLARVAAATPSVARRVKIAGILKNAKYSPAFLKWVESKSFPKHETGNDVKFHSLSPAQQQEVHKQWKHDRKSQAQQHKPESLSDDTLLTPEKFDALQKGDMLWISWSPKVLHKVTGIGKTKTGKPLLEMVQVDPQDPTKEGAKRILHRSSAGDEEHEIHIMPKDPAAGEAAPFTNPDWTSAPEPPAPEPPAPEPAPEPEPAEPPVSETGEALQGKHKDRKFLQGKPRSHHEHKAEPPEELIGLSTHHAMDPELAEATRERFRHMSVGEAKDLLDKLQRAYLNPTKKRMKGYLESGYTVDGIKSLHDALRKHMRSHEGHRYTKVVLEIANKYDLEGEDADELRMFASSQPVPVPGSGGIKVTDAQLMQKFLAKASPETRERMQGMSLADFMIMYKSIMDEDEEGLEA